MIQSKLLLQPKDFKPTLSHWKIDGVLNPAAIRLPNNKIMLYVRLAEMSTAKSGNKMVCPIITSEKKFKTTNEKIHKHEIRSKDGPVMFLKSGICRLSTISHFRKVILSEDGFNVESISTSPDFTGSHSEAEYGVEDPRIVNINGKYYMTYVGVSKHNGVSSYLAESKDLKKWDKLGIIFREQNKDAVLFPEKIDGEYVAFNRPEAFYEFHRPSIWISYSPDLKYWGRDTNVILPRSKSWDSERVGAGPPPIKTDKGWLLIYHGVGEKEGNIVYSVGAALLDLKHPKRIIARTPKKESLISPKEEYENELYENKKVIFPTGIVPDLDKKNLLIYYGAGDRKIGVKKISLDYILNSLVNIK
jgi:beta-1,2-mannobiose phosphorylase / 1,2-beta-oligomannan phosphorylase